MTATSVALLGFVAWLIFLVLSLGIVRTSLVMTGKRAANSFNSSGEDMEPFGYRLTRAHANCYENLPAAAALLLYAIATGQTEVTNGLAYIFLGARIAQSIAHLISTNRSFVLIRFAFFAIQLAIMVIWLLSFFRIV